MDFYALTVVCGGWKTAEVRKTLPPRVVGEFFIGGEGAGGEGWGLLKGFAALQAKMSWLRA